MLVTEFDPLPAESAPETRGAQPPASQNHSFWTRPLLLGYSLPWLAGIFLGLSGIAWFLFWPASSSQEASQRAFGQDSDLESVQQPTSPPVVQLPAPLQTGGLNVPATVSTPGIAGSEHDDVVALIRERRAFEEANREAITRLSDTVRAQTKSLAILQQQLDRVTQDNARLSNLVTALAARPAAEVTGHVSASKKPRSALAGMRLESLQDGMAWVSWQSRMWAVQPGDSLGGVTVRDINAAERSVTTTGGVLR